MKNATIKEEREKRQYWMDKFFRADVAIVRIVEVLNTDPPSHREGKISEVVRDYRRREDDET